MAALTTTLAVLLLLVPANATSGKGCALKGWAVSCNKGGNIVARSSEEAVVQAALQQVVVNNALTAEKRRIINKLASELENIVKKLPGFTWSAGDAITVEGSVASGTALTDGDADLTVWTQQDFTRAMRKKFADLIASQLGGGFTLDGNVTIGAKAVQVVVETDTSDMPIISFKTSLDDRSTTVILHVDIVFDSSTFGRVVAEHATEDMYPLPDVVRSAVILFKLAKAAKAPGLWKVKGFAWDALVLQRYDAFLAAKGREPTILELLQQVLTAFPDKGRDHCLNLSGAVRQLEHDVESPMMPADTCKQAATSVIKHRVPHIYFASVLDKGNFIAAGNTATHLARGLAGLLPYARAGATQQQLVERILYVMTSSWGGSVHTSL